VTRLDFDPDTDYNALTHQIDLLLPTLERASRYTVTINSSDDRGIQDRAKNVSNGNLEFSFSTITNWYVDGQVSSSGDGTSWAEAFATIQEGIDYSVENGCDEVWVKRGQYIILIPIEMNKAIGIYGGFGGSESSKVDRTIDMERLSMIRPSYDEEDYTPIEVNHLMRLSGSGAAASESHFIIDGFELFSGGHEESAIFEDSNEEGNGGGIYSNFAGELADHKLTIKNCSFSYNSANSGGAIYLNRVDSAIIQECNFNYNEAVLSDFGIGGAILSNQSDLMIFGCKFRWNKAIKKGGALYQILDKGNSRIINSVFSSNNVEEEGEGGAISLESSSSKIVNCTFYNNGSNIRDGEGLSIYGVDASPVIVNSIFWNNEIDKREIIFSSSTPNVSTCIIKGGYEGEDIIDLYPNFIAPERGDFHIYNNSPCVDKGSNEAFQVLNIPSQDYDGNKRIVGIIDNSNPLIDIGAFEYQGIQEGVVYY
jgi:predicted outer membrane repeat protein